MENTELNAKKLEQIKDILSSIQMNSLEDSLIKDNKIYFEYLGKSYRGKMPSQKDMADAYKKKDQTYLKMIQEEICLTKNQIKQVLKDKQGIDLDILEEERNSLQKELQDVYMDLALLHPDNKEKCDIQKEKIAEIENRFTDVFIKITEYLAPALENQLEKVYIEFLTARCIEVEEENTWKSVWIKYEDFQNDTNILTSECVKHMTYLLIRTNK